MKLLKRSLSLIMTIGVLAPIASQAQETDSVATGMPVTLPMKEPLAVQLNDPSAETQGTVVKLSREECIAIALQDNPTIRVANLEVKRLDYSKKEVQGSLWPNIDFSGAYQRTIDLQTMRMNIGGQSQSLKVGSQNTWNFGFTASMPIISPTLWKSIQISDVQILSALESARASKLDMVEQVN